MTTEFYSNRKLKDKKIVESLKRAAQWYEDGAILEVKDLVYDIYCSITYWEQDQE